MYQDRTVSDIFEDIEKTRNPEKRVVLVKQLQDACRELDNALKNVDPKSHLGDALTYDRQFRLGHVLAKATDPLEDEKSTIHDVRLACTISTGHWLMNGYIRF